MGQPDRHGAYSDRNELNYVLRRWGKPATAANRRVLARALDAFNADAAWEPHTRAQFIRYAKESGLLSGTGGDRAVLRGDRAGNDATRLDNERSRTPAASLYPAGRAARAPVRPDGQRREAYRAPAAVPTARPTVTARTPPRAKLVAHDAYRPRPTGAYGQRPPRPEAGSSRTALWVALGIGAAAVVVLALVFALPPLMGSGRTAVRDKDQATPALVGRTQQGSVAEPPPVQAPLAASQAPEAPASLPTATQSAPAPEPAPAVRALKAADIPESARILRFLADSPDALAPGGETALAALIQALSGVDEGNLVLVGHAADIGYPEGQERLSAARAEWVAARLRASGLPSGVVIRTEGRGAADMIADPDPERAMELSRRVEVRVE
ncbi:MAG: OmpA family protein [Spirochaetales bacterium]|nr:OmpA family protein [Spirochaetales bacterium]